LFAGVSEPTSRTLDKERPTAETEPPEQDVVPAEEIEAYDRSMSPALIDITKLSMEERQIDILTEQENLRSLVNSYHAWPFYT
jgi:hypothetical protein